MYVSACHIYTFDSKRAYIDLKYSVPEQFSLKWELLQTLGLKWLFGYEHIRLRYEAYPTFNRLVTQTLCESAISSAVYCTDLKIDSCNWLGVHASVLAMDWYGKEALSRTPFTNMTINGKIVAAIQNVDNFSFA